MGWTIPRGPVEIPTRASSPASTKYEPHFRVVEKHVPAARFVARRDYQLGPDFSAPGQHEPKPLPKPHLFVSKLPRDQGSFLSIHSDSPDFMIRPRGLGELPMKGGSISRTGRASPVVGNGSRVSHRVEPSVIDVPPPVRKGGVAFISRCPVPRASATKQSVTVDQPFAPSAFEKCGIPAISFPAARFATRTIEMDHDDYAHIDDPKLHEDLKFLKGVREDIRRWDLKSRFH